MKKIMWLAIIFGLIVVVSLVLLDNLKYKYNKKPLLTISETAKEIDSGFIKEYRSMLYTFSYYETEFVQGKSIDPVSGSNLNKFDFDIEAVFTKNLNRMPYMSSYRNFYLIGVKDIILSFHNGTSMNLKEALAQRYVSFDHLLGKAKNVQNVSIDSSIKVYAYGNFVIMVCNSNKKTTDVNDVYIGSGNMTKDYCN